MMVTKIEIENFDKEYLIFTTSRPTGMPSDFGPVNYVHRYVIKIEDAKKMLRFLLEGDERRCEEDAHECGA